MHIYRFIKVLVLASMTIGYFSNTAMAAYEVQQDIDIDVASQSFKFNYQWVIEKGKFALTVNSEKGEVLYLFNGKNFYVCRKNDNKSQEFFTNLKTNHPVFKRRFNKGVCREAPANFMAKFYVDPVDAIISLDLNDGRNISYVFNQFYLNAKSPSKIMETSCENLQRSYQIEKKVSKSQSHTFQYQDSPCVASSILWRSKLTREVKKRLLRQANMRNTWKPLSGFVDKQKGLVLSSTGSFERLDVKEQTQKGTRKITTTKVAQIKSVSKTAFALPDAFDVLDPKSLAILTSADAKQAKSKNLDKSSQEEEKKSNVNVILYMILGGIL